jgi:hypothetical protein
MLLEHIRKLKNVVQLKPVIPPLCIYHEVFYLLATLLHSPAWNRWDHINIIHYTIHDDILPKNVSLYLYSLHPLSQWWQFIYFTALCSDFAFLKNGCFNSFLADGLFVGSFIRQVAIILLKDYKTSREINQYCHTN